MSGRKLPRPLSLVVLVTAASMMLVAPSEGAGFLNWPAFMFSAEHSSYNAAATTITTSNATHLAVAWHWQDPAPLSGEPPSGLFASPTVYNGVVYIGSNTGHFYAVSEATGAVIWNKNLGATPVFTCQSKGITSTAAVAPDPNTGKLTVYVGAGDGYLYALKASDGSTVWSAPVNVPSAGVNDKYNWSSPTVAGGRVYLGISSQCDDPLTQGGLVSVDQATGAIDGTYHAVPDGIVGGSIWSSAATDGSNVYVSTGNGNPLGGDQGDSFSIVRIDPATMAKQDSWAIPPAQRGTDGDFGGSPTLFQANLGGQMTTMVGAQAKNAHFYALRRSNLSAGPVWEFDLHQNHCVGGAGAVSSAIWDGSHLFAASVATKINGTCYNGSIRELDPATGAAIWETGLPGKVYGNPTMDGAGVIAVSTYDFNAPNAVYFINAGTGSILYSIPLPSVSFPQPTFADGYVFVTSQSGDLWAYTPGSQLSVSRAGSGGGAVSSTPSGIDCGTTCSANFVNGTSVTLTPTAAPGSAFTGWSGACTGTGSCVLTMSTDQSVTANFTSTGTVPDLSISQTGSADPTPVDANLTYTLTVANGGTAGTATVTDTLPAGVIFGSATPSQGSCSGSGPVTCNLGSVAGGGSATVTITIKPITPGAISNQADVAPTDPTPADNTSTLGTTVSAQKKTVYAGVSDSGFSPATMQVMQGNTLQWNFFGPGVHSATDGSLLGCSGGTPCPMFDSGSVSPINYYPFRFSAAGTYPVVDGSSSNTQTVSVPTKASPSTGTTASTFTITWASEVATGNYVFDVQIKRPGSSAWLDWKTGVTDRRATFDSTDPLWAGTGKYQFRARLRNASTGNSSGYSKGRRITVNP